MIQTVILDLDDTLYDEIDYCKSGFAAVADHLARLPDAPTPQQVFQSLWRQFNAGNRTKTFNAALDELAIACDDRLIRELIHVYRNHTPNITLPADSRRVLHRLSREYDLALLTD
ncbi:MAG: HAD hydrolase-like protein, partial [Sedimentisphaerales bacterium]|nr:HAD hydrolase-like protein [Sedimentisphaerales bacterium]